MSGTAGAFYADTAHTGGWYWHGAANLEPFATQLLLLTRNALADYSWNRTPAAGVENYNVVSSLDELKRLIEVPFKGMPFQEQFGTAAGTAGYPADAPGFPPYTGASQLTPPLNAPPKGVQITDVAVVYTVGVVNLTAASLSLNRTVFANNVAPAITNLPIAATALPLVVQANPYVAVRAVTAPAFEITDLSDVSCEFAFTMANTGTVRVYGIGFHCNFNYD